MKHFHWLGVLALLATAACGGARGGSLGGGGGGGGDDAAAGTDASSGNDSVSADVVTAPDVPVTNDTPVAPDVPVEHVDVPMVTLDVPVIPVDVPPEPSCGDGTCNPGESCESCRADCASSCPPPPDVPMARCGDGACNNGENCSTCMQDCGPCMTTGAVTDPCPSTVPQGPNRNCGWRLGMTFSCSPGRATMVGCTDGAGMGSLCQPSYGACTGDPVMRVCPGNMPCTAAMALPAASGNFDDQCGTCPSAYVTCPSSGQIYVLTGDYDSNQSTQRGTCAPAVR